MRLLTLVSVLTGLTLSACSHVSYEGDDLAGCELVPVLIEDFDDLSVSPNRIGPARWTAHTPWNGDFGDARFTDPGRSGPFSVEDGILTIKAWKDRKGQWRSGLLAAADRSGRGYGTQFGYFEARMKFPPGPGTWPAFWLMPLKPVGHVDGRVEIDVVEYYGRDTDRFHAVQHIHYADPDLKWDESIVPRVPDESLIDQFNTYGVDISDDWIIYFFNREEFWRQPRPAVLRYPMFPLVNLALGSGWPIDETPDPSLMLVDYVHVYGRGRSSDCAPGPSQLGDAF